MAENKSTLKDGIYTSDNATYFVKDGKVMMKLMGSFYKTTENFMVGARYREPLSDVMDSKFESAYNECSFW